MLVNMVIRNNRLAASLIRKFSSLKKCPILVLIRLKNAVANFNLSY